MSEMQQLRSFVTQSLHVSQFQRVLPDSLSKILFQDRARHPGLTVTAQDIMAALVSQSSGAQPDLQLSSSASSEPKLMPEKVDSFFLQSSAGGVKVQEASQFQALLETQFAGLPASQFAGQLASQLQGQQRSEFAAVSDADSSMLDQ
jgi:hypothetical protein